MKKPIIPISRDALDIESRLEELCETYEADTKADGNDITTENNEDYVMNDIENMGLALNETREVLNNLKCFISEARDNRGRVESVKGMERRAADYWQPIDAQNFLA